MCYEKPGPRCSNCTWKRVQKLLETTDMNDPKQVERLREAMLAWQKTPDGIAQLRKDGKHELADFYEKQRAKQLAAYHASVAAKKAAEGGQKKPAPKPGPRPVPGPGLKPAVKPVAVPAGANPVLPQVPAAEPKPVVQVVERRVPGADRGAGVLVSGSRSWVVAPEGKTAMMCSRCEDFLPADHPYGPSITAHGTQGVPCLTPGCRGRISSQSIAHPYLGVAQDSAKFFDPQAVADARWYHVTDRGEEWYNSLHEYAESKAAEFGREPEGYLPLVHLGTHQASMERLSARGRHAIRGSREPRWALYEVSLKDVADISPVVTLDDNQYAPQQVGDLWARRSTPGVYSEQSDYRAVTRYVNQFESIGSISLVADPSRFTIEKVTLID